MLSADVIADDDVIMSDLPLPGDGAVGYDVPDTLPDTLPDGGLSPEFGKCYMTGCPFQRRRVMMRVCPAQEMMLWVWRVVMVRTCLKSMLCPLVVHRSWELWVPDFHQPNILNLILMVGHRFLDLPHRNLRFPCLLTQMRKRWWRRRSRVWKLGVRWRIGWAGTVLLARGYDHGHIQLANYVYYSLVFPSFYREDVATPCRSDEPGQPSGDPTVPWPRITHEHTILAQDMCG